MRPEPADETDLAPQDLAAAATDMDRILEQEPTLSDFGFGPSDSYRTHEEGVAEFRADRERIRDPQLWRSSPSPADG